MWPWKPPRARSGSVTLLLVRVENMHAVADALPASALSGLLRDVRRVCERVGSAHGGRVVRWDASGVAGSTALCAWPDGPRTASVDFRALATSLRTGVREAVDRNLPPATPPTRVTVALGRGPCVYRLERRRIAEVLGAAVDRLCSAARPADGGGDRLLVGPTLAPAPEGRPPTG